MFEGNKKEVSSFQFDCRDVALTSDTGGCEEGVKISYEADSNFLMLRISMKQFLKKFDEKTINQLSGKNWACVSVSEF